MKGKRYTEEQIIRILKEVESGKAVKEVRREQGVSEQTVYRWRNKYGGLDVPELRRLKELEEETRRLKHPVADLAVDIQIPSTSSTSLLIQN